MKRCKSAQELPAYTKGDKRKKSKREKSPNARREYLEGIEEYNTLYRCLDTVVRTPSSSSSISSNSPRVPMVRFCPSSSTTNGMGSTQTMLLLASANEGSASSGSEVLDLLRNGMEQFRRDFSGSGTEQIGVQQNPKEAFFMLNNKPHRIGDVLWFHLQAFFANRPMSKRNIHKSLVTQDRHILKMRAEKCVVLDEIRNFRADDPPPSATCLQEQLYTIYDPVYNLYLHASMDRVGHLLERFEGLAGLYPTLNALKKATLPEEMGGGLMMDVPVQLRISSMYMWYNTLQDLLRKINEAGEYLGLIEGSSRKSSIRNVLRHDPLQEHQLSETNHLHMRHHSSSSSIMQQLWPLSQQIAAGIRSQNSDSRKSLGVISNSSFTSAGSHNNSFQSVDMAECTGDAAGTDVQTLNACTSPSTDTNSDISEAFMELYKKVVGRSLRLRGMIEVLKRLSDICQTTLEKACLSLLMPLLYAEITSCSSTLTNFVRNLKRRYGVQEYNVDLPPPFHVPGQNSCGSGDPVVENAVREGGLHFLDLLTLNTLIEDSHDCLQAAINVKNKYVDMLKLTSQHSEEKLGSLECFDDKLNKVFQNYLSYLRFWVQTASIPTNCDAEWCDKVVEKLGNEWKNAKQWSVSINRGEITAARMFCNIGKDLLDLMVKRYITDKFDAVEMGILDVKDSAEDNFILIDDSENMKTSSIFVLCRALKEMIRNLRERSLRSLTFIRLLCSELEICARYVWHDERDPSSEEGNGCDKLITFSNHTDCNFLVLCNKEIVNESEYIASLLNATCYTSRLPNKDSTAQQSPPVHTKKVADSGYLVLLPCQLISVKPHQMNSSNNLKLSYGTKTTLEHYITANNIYLISESRCVLEANRVRFEKAVEKFVNSDNNTVRLEMVDDFCSCNDELFEEVSELKRLAFETVQEVWAYARDLGQYVLNGRRMEELDKNEYDSLKATLLQAWNAAFECHKELSRIVSLSMHKDFCQELVNCVNQWSSFVNETIKESKAAPRWAMTPLNYLLSMPSHIFKTQHGLTKMKIQVECQKLTDSIKSCMENMRTSSLPEQTSDTQLEDKQSSGCSFTDELGHLNLEEYLDSKKMSVADRLKKGVDNLEERRQEQLLNERKIGQVVETKTSHDFNSFFFPSKKAPFEWQRLENRNLGSGSFGSVYLVMNLRDKCLTAMKQIHVRRENNAALKALVDEVDILRQLDHPNLVKYYGVEVHKDELLIFMEYCSEGTLSRVCREGLDLGCVRRYTHYLLKAVDYIHDHAIVHRDIKPANIFLGRKNVLKLGDFGCSFRLRDTCTGMGELVSYVGTTNYMAPEVQTNGGLMDESRDSESSGSSVFVPPTASSKYIGYGRAVDIWSTGCVVLEMLTGKKPYYYLDHEFQVIYHLGSGIQPRIPADIQKCHIGPEQRNCYNMLFLTLCLRTLSKIRWTQLDKLPFQNRIRNSRGARKMSPEAVFWSLVSFYWAAFIWDLYLAYRQYKVHLTNEKRPNHLDKHRFGFVEAIFGRLQTSAVLLLNVLPWLWSVTGTWSRTLGANGEIWHSIMFVSVSSVAETIIGLPFSYYDTFVIEQKHGFNKETLPFFLKDKVKKMFISILITAPIVAGVIWIVSVGGTYFFFYVWLFLCVVIFVMMTIYPEFIAPLFDKYTPLPESKLKEKIEALASRVAFPLKKLYVVQGSKRSSHSNAYMYGFWKNKRIVLYDTLLSREMNEELKKILEEENKSGAEVSQDSKEENPKADKEEEQRKQLGMNDDEVVAVLGHELGHWKLWHTVGNLVISEANALLLLAVFAYFYRQETLYTAFGFYNTQPVVIGLLLVFQFVTAPYNEVVSVAMSFISRWAEFSADRFSAELGYSRLMCSALINSWFQKPNIRDRFESEMMRSVPSTMLGCAKSSLLCKINALKIMRSQNNLRHLFLHCPQMVPSTVKGSSQPVVIPKHEPLADEKSEMLQSIDIDDLPRAQKRYAKEFEEYNVIRIKEIFQKKYKIILWASGFSVLIVSIYAYTIYNIKQETFLQEIDEEMESEKVQSGSKKH
uniref:Ste24 endopeptidase n=1 Tax=Ditylenchus dipsaci TaxID=166011 RepID=A0A915CVI5_9BILA